MSTHQVVLDIPEMVLLAEKTDAVSFACELRILAAVKLFELGRLSSVRAAELAGIPRVEFLLTLDRYGVFPLEAELADLEHQNAMATISYDLPPSTFSALRLSPKELAREMRVAACIQWYAQGLVYQEQAAEIAGLSRADFLEELFRRQVPACQVTLEELLEEIEHE